MPGSFLSEVERDRLNRFPSLIPDEDLIAFFTLSDSDKTEVKKQRGDHNRFGFALQICIIRYLGFLPQDFSSAPIEAVLFVGEQLHLQVGCQADYGRRFQTRQDHLKSVLSYLRFRRANPNDWKNLRVWLIERALEHDKPTLLLEFACEYLHMNKIMRPGITRLEGLVIEARQKTWSKTYMQLESILDKSTQTLLDGLLIPDPKIGKTPLLWLRQGATSNSARDILNSMNKIYFLRNLGADNWDLSLLNPNRLRFLAQVGRRSTNQYLQRLFPERRYPILIAFLRQSLIDITDEAVEVFNQILWDLYGDARDDLDKFQKGVSRSKDKNLKLFRLIIPVLLTPDIEEADVRSIIFTQVPAKDLVRAYEELSMIVRENDGHFDFFAKRYSYIQQFAPEFLQAFSFKTIYPKDSLTNAINILRQCNAKPHKQPIPKNAPVSFVSSKWKPYVFDKKGEIVRRYYVLCVLWELRNALRAGNIWLNHSRLYASLESYFIPLVLWPEHKADVCRLLKVPQDGTIRLEERRQELEQLLKNLNQILAIGDPDAKVRLEKGEIILSPLEAEKRPESVEALEDEIVARIPQVDLGFR